MKIVLFILVTLALLLSCTTKHPKVLLSSITLEDGFDNDTISIFYGIDIILNSQAITSSKIIGNTDVRIEVFDSANTLIIEDGQKNYLKRLSCLSDCLNKNIVLKLNDKSYPVQIDTTNKYVGISKVSVDSIRIDRQNTVRYYD